MKVKLIMREKLYADVEFEVVCKSEEVLESVLNKIGEGVSADEMEQGLISAFGSDNVKSEGINVFDNIYPADECELVDWIEEGD